MIPINFDNFHIYILYVFRPNQSLAQVQLILDEASRISAYLPNVAALRSAVDMATRWTTSVDKLLVKMSFLN